MYKEIIKRTLDLLFEKKYILTKALLIPFFLLIVIEFYSTHGIGETTSSFYLYALVALSFLITIVMSINVHRILLLSKEETPTWGVYTFGTRELTFILKGIGLGILLGLTFFILYFIAMFLGKAIQSLLGSSLASIYSVGISIVIVVFIGIVFSRISLIFPAISIDKPIYFSDAFELTKNHKFLVFITVLVIPVFFAVVVGFVYGLAIEFLMALISEKLSILYSLLNVFITVFTIGFLSVTYEYIISKQEVIEVEEKLNEIEFFQDENNFKMVIDERYDISFEQIKEDLLNQYEGLGFNEIVVDKETSFMLKNKDNQEAYISVSHMNDEFKVETFNVKEKPILSLD